MTTINTCANREFGQYDEKGELIYSYRYSQNWDNTDSIRIYDSNESSLGHIERTLSCSKLNYNFYENNNLKYYIEERGNCCNSTFTFYGLDKNIESVITKKLCCCENIFVEYDSYNTETNRAICKKNCYPNYTFYENDSCGNPKFIVREKFDCNNSIFKIYNPSYVEINLTEKSLFNEGFTKIQIILIVLILFPRLSSTDPEC